MQPVASPVPRHAPRWYALYLRSRFEKRVDQELRGAGIESYLPLIEEVHLWSDRKQKVLEPLFRGYCFVRTDLRDKIAILDTEGVVCFVQANGRPNPIPDEQINWVRIVARDPAAVRREKYLEVGQRVCVAAGPFKGVEGIVLRAHGSTRVVITLESIGQSIAVSVDPLFLEEQPETRVLQPLTPNPLPAHSPNASA
ncbi:MAG TPA: UpxY family transcription antiterminator [Bacteroidota bacterium]